jgi:nucleoside-triphosphatase THEP1
MDELGFLESGSPEFCDAVTKLFDANYTIIAVIKNKSTPFLDKLRARGDAETYCLDADSRETLYELVKSRLFH